MQNEISDLIEKITPLNNRYRDLVDDGASGNEVLHVMWHTGEILNSFVDKHKIKPHALYWQVYGKAEGIKRSYITRDFLSYCLRIYKYFLNEQKIDDIFPSLRRYSLFREAFPLLENPKYKLDPNQNNKVIQLLNSNNNPQDTKDYLLEIKARKIGLKNTRTQRLEEAKPYAENFRDIYNEVYRLVKNNDHKSINDFVEVFTVGLIKMLSEVVSGLTQENLYIPEIEANGSNLPENWQEFIANLKSLIGGSVEDRNRFRRLVSPNKLFALADMLNAFTIKDGIYNYRKRKKI
jgi:hypothetical protein